MDKLRFARTFARLDEALAGERSRLEEVSAGARRGREMRALVFEEISGSCALAGARLPMDALVALVERGVALGELPLRTLLIAAGYADAALHVAQTQRRRRAEPWLRLDEVVELHARATRLQPDLHPGAWRTTTLRALGSGMVPPPFWLVPRETAALVDRCAAGPPPGRSPILWICDVHERFERLRPFSAGNGRTGRLVANLLLRRLGLPPFAVAPRYAEGYIAALSRADAGDPWSLAVLIARSVLAGLQRLGAASAAELVPVASLTRAKREALYKAIQRGRVDAVRRGGRLFVSQREAMRIVAR